MCWAIGREGGSKNGCHFQSDGQRGNIWGIVQTICKDSGFYSEWKEDGWKALAEDYFALTSILPAAFGCWAGKRPWGGGVTSQEAVVPMQAADGDSSNQRAVAGTLTTGWIANTFSRSSYEATLMNWLWRVTEREELRRHQRFCPSSCKYEVAIHWDGRVAQRNEQMVPVKPLGSCIPSATLQTSSLVMVTSFSPDSEPTVTLGLQITPDYSQSVDTFKSHPDPLTSLPVPLLLLLLLLPFLLPANFWKHYFLFAASTFLSISQPITLSLTSRLQVCQGFQWALKSQTCFSLANAHLVCLLCSTDCHSPSPSPKSLFCHGFPETTFSFISFHFPIICSLSPRLVSLPLFFPYITCLQSVLFLFSPHSHALSDFIHSPPSISILISYHLASFLNPSHCSWTSISNFTKLTQSKAYPIMSSYKVISSSLQSSVTLTIHPATSELVSEPHLPHEMWF